MENNKLFGFIKKQKNISAIIVLTLIFGLLAPLNIFQRIDYRFYDMELKLLTPPEESEDIALVEVDDNSLSYIGSWPWQRDILSEVLFRLKEDDYAVLEKAFAPRSGRSSFVHAMGAMASFTLSLLSIINLRLIKSCFFDIRLQVFISGLNGGACADFCNADSPPGVISVAHALVSNLYIEKTGNCLLL